MPAIFEANRLPHSDDALSKRALRAYLAGLGAATALIVGTTIIAGFGLNLVFG